MDAKTKKRGQPQWLSAFLYVDLPEIVL